MDYNINKANVITTMEIRPTGEIPKTKKNASDKSYLCGDYTQFNLKHIEIVVKGQKNYWPITGLISAQLNY